jgi:hypothetical protein
MSQVLIYSTIEAQKKSVFSHSETVLFYKCIHMQHASSGGGFSGPSMRMKASGEARRKSVFRAAKLETGESVSLLYRKIP